MAGTVSALVFEWVLTNGSLPGFADRVRETKHRWTKNESDFTVWRGQGKAKRGIPQLADPSSLLSDVRPVISTTTNKESALVFGEKDCCLYQIVVKPGVRYLNIEEVGKGFISPTVVDYVRSLIPEYRTGFTSRKTPNMSLIKAFKTRIAKEHEILIESGGIFADPVSFSDSTPKQFHTSYKMKTGGKKKTRRNKIVMEKGEYLREHHHLFKVLRNPTRRALNAELRKQKRELRERGLKG